MDTNRDRRNMQVLNQRELKRLPINLRKKAIREARNMAGMQKQIPQRQRRPRAQQNDFERAEHNAMLHATTQKLQEILANFTELNDISYDCTPAELRGKIALAEGRGITIYVQRDGLSTLQIVLHQSAPTIAQLKKAIATISLAQHKRRQRYEEQQQQQQQQRRAVNEDEATRAEDGDRRRQQVMLAVGGAEDMCSRSSCELVNSAQRNGHEHRALVSWRFLWRCFALFNVDTNQPIDDNVANGRATLTALGIENGAKLKFVHRVKYFGRRRQT